MTQDQGANVGQESKPYMERDFQPDQRLADPALRIASALEYIAFQLGQINRKLDGLNASSLSAGTPDQAGSPSRS